MTERRRTSRAENQIPTRRPPPPDGSTSRGSHSTAPPPSGVKAGAQSSVNTKAERPQSQLERTQPERPQMQTRPTLSVAIVALGDIPTLLGLPPEDGVGPDGVPMSLAPLLLAIDGHLTVAEIADRIRIEPEQARAMVAELVDSGVVALSRKAASTSGVGTVRTPARSMDYWLAGLKPRTK